LCPSQFLTSLANAAALLSEELSLVQVHA
jgi:hypothetical protein